jgi:histone H3/H4
MLITLAALARDSRPTEPSPQPPPRRTRHSALDLPDVEDGPDPAAPRLSMALDDMYDDDSYHEHPPRQSLLPDLPEDVDGGTVQSLEFGRRAISEVPRMTFPGRLSERFADLSELGMVEEEYEDGEDVVARRNRLLNQGVDEALDEDDTATQIQAVTGRRHGRPSDVDLGVFGDADDDSEEPTFRFLIPERIRATLREDQRDEQEDSDLSHADGPPPTYDEEEEEEQDEPAEDDENEVTAAITGDPTEAINAPEWESDHDLNDDMDLAAYREEESALDRSLQTQSPERPAAAKQRGVRKAKEPRISQRGLEYPSFPVAPVKKLALGFMKSQGSKVSLSKETLTALVKVTDDFFEQVGIDLAAYAQHGGRRMIEESDVIALMKRYAAPLYPHSCPILIHGVGLARPQTTVHRSPSHKRCCRENCSRSCEWNRLRSSGAKSGSGSILYRKKTKTKIERLRWPDLYHSTLWRTRR